MSDGTGNENRTDRRDEHTLSEAEWLRELGVAAAMPPGEPWLLMAVHARLREIGASS